MSKEPVMHRCESYMTNFKRCWLAAKHIERCPNGINYLCDHHARMRNRQGGVTSVLNGTAANTPPGQPNATKLSALADRVYEASEPNP